MRPTMVSSESPFWTIYLPPLAFTRLQEHSTADRGGQPRNTRGKQQEPARHTHSSTSAPAAATAGDQRGRPRLGGDVPAGGGPFVRVSWPQEEEGDRKRDSAGNLRGASSRGDCASASPTQAGRHLSKVDTVHHWRALSDTGRGEEKASGQAGQMSGRPAGARGGAHLVPHVPGGPLVRVVLPPLCRLGAPLLLLLRLLRLARSRRGSGRPLSLLQDRQAGAREGHDQQGTARGRQGEGAASVATGGVRACLAGRKAVWQCETALCLLPIFLMDVGHL